MPQKPEQNFSYRYYEAIRRKRAAAELGRMAVMSSDLEEFSGYEKRQYDEMHSALVEGLRGTLSTHYSFELKEGKLVAEDGEDIEVLLSRGLEDAEVMAAADAFYEPFLPQRAKAELEEHKENVAMAKGEAGYNTVVTFSPYTQELDTSDASRKKLVHAAQKPYWQRAMVRVSHWDGHKLHIFTRSIDNSDLELLKETAVQSLGYSFAAEDSTAMLAERIHLNVEDERWQLLPEMVVHEADKLIATKLDKKCKQGRPLEDAASLDDFVGANRDIVDHLLQTGNQLGMQHDDFYGYKRAFDAEVYNHLALLEARLSKGSVAEVKDIGAAAGAAGAQAAADGRVYDMCGTVLGASNSNQNTPAQTGFESLMRMEGKKITCPECKNKVVVPKKDLEAGVLTCSDCGYGVDVCTGKKLSRSNRVKTPQARLGFFDTVTADLKRYEEQAKVKNVRTQSKEPATAWLW